MFFANPDETTFVGAYYVFSFGAYGTTEVCVLGRPDRVEKALELATEWLAEHAPGLFTEPDYADAAREVGVTPDQYMRDDLDDGTRERVCQVAEADLTYTESGWLASWEWSVVEHDGEPFDAPRFQRFDVVEAHAAYQAAWHQGQWSAGYRDLSRALALGAEVQSFDALSSNGQALYRQLVLRDGR